MENQKPTRLSFLRGWLKDEKLVARELRRAHDILEAVSEDSGVAIHEIKGPSRFRNYVDARQEAVVLMYHLGLSWHFIARMINRDHTSVGHLLRRAGIPPNPINTERVLRGVANRRRAQALTTV